MQNNTTTEDKTMTTTKGKTCGCKVHYISAMTAQFEGLGITGRGGHRKVWRYCDACAAIMGKRYVTSEPIRVTS